MKKPLVFLAMIVMALSVNCTPETAETFSGLECLNKLIKFSANDDDLSCSQLIGELKKLKKSCGTNEDQIQETIDALEASCED